MTIFRIDREHISINEGGRFLTFYWRWTERGQWRRTMFRLWAGLDSRRAVVLLIDHGKFKFRKPLQ